MVAEDNAPALNPIIPEDSPDLRPLLLPGPGHSIPPEEKTVQSVVGRAMELGGQIQAETAGKYYN